MADSAEERALILEKLDQLRPRLDAVGSCPAATVYSTGQMIRRRFDRSFKVIQITSSQFTLLSAIGWLGESSISGLTALVGRDQTTLSRSLESLRDRGWISITPDPDDRRIHMVRLTEVGYTKLTAAMNIWEEVREELREGLGPGELEALIRRCRDVMQLLKR